MTELWTLELTSVQDLQQLQTRKTLDCECEDSMIIIISSDHNDEQESTDAIQADHSGFTFSSSSCSTINRGKQASGFKKCWLKGREHWLVYVRGMHCKLCIKYNKRPFNRDTWNQTPCIRYRLNSIVLHEKCSAHQDSLKVEAASSTSVNIGHALQLP